jgi:hypothetical protein
LEFGIWNLEFKPFIANVFRIRKFFFAPRPGIFFKKPDKQIKTIMKREGLKKKMALMLILLAGWQMTARPGVMITGILDGTLTGGCPKVIEIYVSGTVNLNYYELWRSQNGAPFGSGTGAISSLFGIYTNTFVYLVKTDHVNAFHDVFGNEGIYANVFPMGIISGNGNDGFQLRQKVGSVVIDQVWMEDATDSYLDSYWYRKHGTGPDGGWDPSAWETPGNDALDGLDEAGLRASVPFGTYAVTWQGLTASWADSSNWSTGIPPSFQTNVLVPDTVSFFPVITNLPGNPATCMNLTVRDTARLTVNAGKALTVYGDLVLDTLNDGGPGRGMVLKSELNSTPPGSLILLGIQSGTMKIERYIEKNNSWHFISAPVAGQLLQPGFVPDPLDGSFDLYFWDEGAAEGEGWINVRDSAGAWNQGFEDSFISGKGYLVAYSGSNTGENIRLFTGLVNSGNLAIPIEYGGNNWNLVGNPYSCALDWSSEGIEKSAVAAGTMYIWDPSLNNNLGGYRAHNGTTGTPAGTTSIIPATQGFFVQALSMGSINIDVGYNEPLVHGDQANYKDVAQMPSNRMRLKIKRGSFSDEALVYFDPAASNGFDVLYDAEKLFNGLEGCPEIYTFAGNDIPLCINILSGYPVSVPVGINYKENDSLIISLFDFEEFAPEIGIFLEDISQGYWIDLRDQPEFHFKHDIQLAGPRFLLHFMNVEGLADNKETERPGIRCSGNTIFVTNPGETGGNLDIISLDGKCIISNIIPNGSYNLSMAVPRGVYVLVLRTGSGLYREKILVY